MKTLQHDPKSALWIPARIAVHLNLTLDLMWFPVIFFTVCQVTTIYNTPKSSNALSLIRFGDVDVSEAS